MTKRTKRTIVRLAQAISAAAMISSTAAQAQTLDIDTPEAVLQIAAYVEQGNVAAARATIAQLRAVGIEEIVVAGRTVSLLVLDTMLADGITPTELELILALLGAAGEETFVGAAPFPTTSLVSDSDDDDEFPSGSAG